MTNEATKPDKPMVTKNTSIIKPNISKLKRREPKILPLNRNQTYLIEEINTLGKS